MKQQILHLLMRVGRLLAAFLLVAAAASLIVVYQLDQELPSAQEIRSIYHDRSDTSGQFLRLKKIPAQVIQAFLAAENSYYLTEGSGFRRCLLNAAISFVGDSAIRCAEGIGYAAARRVAIRLRPHWGARHLHMALLALKIEAVLSREEAMAMVLNTFYLGHHIYGIDKASSVYFGKSTSALTIAEAALLAALPKAPNFYDPVRHPERARKRRDWVLKVMDERGMISNAEYQAARLEALPE